MDFQAPDAYVTEVEGQRSFLECLSNSDSYSAFVYPLVGIRQQATERHPEWTHEQIEAVAVLNVTASIILYKLLSLSNGRALSVALELTFEWFDPNFRCGTSRRYTAVETAKLWTPSFRLDNPASSVSHFVVDPLGSAFRRDDQSGSFVRATLKATVDAACNNMSFIHFPFDEQICDITLFTSDAVRFSTKPAIVSNGASNPEWTLLDVALSSHNQSQLSITLEMKRESYYYVLNLVSPAVTMQSLVALVFILPTDHGCKVKLAATLVLALYVLQESVLQLIPHIKQEDLPEIIHAFRSGLYLGVLALAEGVFLQMLHILAPGFPKSVNWLATFLFLDIWRRKCCRKQRTRTRTRKLYLHCSESEVPLNSRLQSLRAPLVEKRTANGLAGVVLSLERSNSDERLHEILELSRSILKEMQRLSEVQSQVLNFAKEVHRENKELLISSKRSQAEKKRVRIAWKRFEYAINCIGFFACVATTVYYFGVLFHE